MPYPASWIDRLMTAIKKQPAPYWLIYLLAGGGETLALQLIVWVASPATRFVIQPETAIFPLWTWGVLALITVLNQEALAALHRFQPLLDIEEEDKQALEYEITTMPARIVLWATPFWLLLFVVIAFSNPTISQHRDNPVLFSAVFLAGAGAFTIGSAIYVHTAHQLRIVNRLYLHMHKINMFHLAPVYAFSGLTAQTAIGFVLLIVLTQLLYPYSFEDANVLLLYVGQILLALAVFVLPLRHAHQRLTAGKQRLQADAAQRMNTILQHLHTAVDERDVAAVDSLNRIMAAITNELNVLDKIPTWPWPPGTLRAVTTILLVPIALFLVQAVLKRWLGL